MNRDIGTNDPHASKHRGPFLTGAVRRWASQIHLLGKASTEAEDGAFGQLKLKQAITVLAMVARGRDSEIIQRIGSIQGWEVLVANDWEEGLQLLSLRKTGVILVDRRLIEPDWQGSIRMLLLPNRTLCPVLISPTTNDSFWEEVIRQGGYDVLKSKHHMNTTGAE